MSLLDNMDDSIVSAEPKDLVNNKSSSSKKSAKKSNPSTPSGRPTTTEERLKRKVENMKRLDKVGGLDAQISQLKQLMLDPIENKQYKQIKCLPPHSVLLHGLPGTGKSLLLDALQGELGNKLKFNRIDCKSILTKGPMDPLQQMQRVLTEAEKASPQSVLIIDDIDLLFPARKSPTDQERTLLTLFIEFIDCITDRQRVFVMATARKLEDIEPRLRRARRFEREIEIPAPLAPERKQILKILLKNVNHDLTEDELGQIAQQTMAFTGADLASMVSCASWTAANANHNQIKMEHVNQAKNDIKPSAMRNVQLEVPTVHWTDIAGQDELKQRLIASLIWPIKYRHVYQKFNERQPKGILLYGPPGCSKTMIGKALATECNHRFLSVKGPEIFSKYVGESERTVRDIFDKARQVAPAIIFIDEIDALAIERGKSDGGSAAVNDKVVSTLLNELDGVEQLNDVFVVATTNRPDVIDAGLLRPGRLDSIIYVPLPDFETRRQIFRLRLSKIPSATCLPVRICLEMIQTHLDQVHSILTIEQFKQFMNESDHQDDHVRPTDILNDTCWAFLNQFDTTAQAKPNQADLLAEHMQSINLNQTHQHTSNRRFEFTLNALALLTESYSGAEIPTICHEAFVLALNDSVSRGTHLDHIHLDYYLKAVALVKPRTDAGTVRQYEQFARNFAANHAFR